MLITLTSYQKDNKISSKRQSFSVQQNWIAGQHQIFFSISAYHSHDSRIERILTNMCYFYVYFTLNSPFIKKLRQKHASK